jgi:hypothetical protein
MMPSPAIIDDRRIELIKGDSLAGIDLGRNAGNFKAINYAQSPKLIDQSVLRK